MMESDDDPDWVPSGANKVSRNVLINFQLMKFRGQLCLACSD